MLNTKRIIHYLKRFGGAAAVTAVFAAVVFNASADDVRMLRQLDNSYEGIMPASENGVDEPAVVNINTASVHHLQRISGIGEKLAWAIVEYREAHGGFKSVDELENISGIGGNTLDFIREFITV